MATLKLLRNGDMFFFAKEQPCDWAKSLSKEYYAAKPFPHTVIDDFLPVVFLEKVLENFPSKDSCTVLRQHSSAYLKRGYRPDDLDNNLCRSYLYIFNTSPFLQLLENLTGIQGLIPDPYFTGAGLHEIDQGGKLGVHADFNLYRKLNLIRRINVLVYLNKDWRSEYGGNLELWNESMTECVKSIEPLFNRCVIFNTNKGCFHGHPDPLKCPEDRSRRSIALYYYTAPTEKVVPSHTLNEKTDFKARPGSEDDEQTNQGSLGEKISQKLGSLFTKK